MSVMEAEKQKRLSRLLPGKKWKNSQEMERDMYNGLEEKDAAGVDGDLHTGAGHHHPGKAKEVLHKLSCGVV